MNVDTDTGMSDDEDGQFDDLAFEDRILTICEDQIVLEAAEAVGGKYAPMTFDKRNTVSADLKPGQSMFETLKFLYGKGHDVKADLNAFIQNTSNDSDLREKAGAFLNDQNPADDQAGKTIFRTLSDVLFLSLRNGDKDLRAQTVGSLRNFSAADRFSPRLRAEATKLAEQSDPNWDELADTVADMVCEDLGISDSDDDL